MGLTIDRQSGGFDRMPHELRKTGRSERPSERSVDDGNVISRGMVEGAAQVGMKVGFDIHTSLAPRVSDARCGLVDLAPGHPVNISTRGTDVQHQAVGRALLRAKRPVTLKGRRLGIGPGANCPALRALYSDRRSCRSFSGLLSSRPIAWWIRMRSIFRRESAAPGRPSYGARIPASILSPVRPATARWPWSVRSASMRDAYPLLVVARRSR